MVILREDQVLLKKRVLYIGSSVPIETMEGLEAIQQPLRDRYPVGDDAQLQGIDAWISVLPSGINIHYVEDSGTVIHFPISSLTLCAAVRQVRSVNGSTGEMTSRFVSLTSQQAGGANSKNPAIYSAITRRTKGRRVLECHGFLCASDKDALDLVKATKFADGQHKQTVNETLRTQPSQGQRISSNGSTIFQSANESNGAIKIEGLNDTGAKHNVRLTPGEAIEQIKDAAPEFYDPVPTTGYFYSSPRTEVKKYNVEKLAEKAASDIGPAPSTRATIQRPVPVAMSARGVPPGATILRPMPQPMAPPPGRRPVYVAAPPSRPRFFSPPPVIHRPMYGPPPPRPVIGVPPPPMMAPGVPPPPPPMMGPPPPMMYGPPGPIFVRRPRQRSPSNDSDRSSSGESANKDRNGETSPKVVNGDEDSGSSLSAYRPKTPPRDYDRPADPRGERMSRRDEYERRQRRGDSPRRSPTRMMPPGYGPPYGAGAFGPYYYGPPYMDPMMFRSRSMPPPNRYPTADGKPKKGKKSKKGKKKGKGDRKEPASDFGYPPHLPYAMYGPPPGMYDLSGSRRPRDFRREENQFLNERSFSHRIQEENRKSKGNMEKYPTAYELNDAHFDEGHKTGEFQLY